MRFSFPMDYTACLLLGALVLGSGAKADPATELETANAQIESLATSAREIVVYHTPEELMGRVGFDRSMASSNWVAMMVYRCSSTCNYSIRNLRSLLGSATLSPVRVTSGTISTVIEFRNNGSSVGKIYGYWTGKTILIGDRTYILKKSLAKYFEEHTPLQW